MKRITRSINCYASAYKLIASWGQEKNSLPSVVLSNGKTIIHFLLLSKASTVDALRDRIFEWLGKWPVHYGILCKI